MRALPEKLTSEYAFTGVGCVECPGVVHVRTEGDSPELRFMCRVGHAYSINDLIKGKEQKIEESLWSALESLKELAALLGELRQAGADGGVDYTGRIQNLERQAQVLAQLLQSNDPVVLGASDACEEPDTGRQKP